MLGLATKRQKNFLKVNCFCLLIIFSVPALASEDDLASIGPSSLKIQFIAPCLPMFEAENKLTWEEKTENGLIRGESSFTLSPPLSEKGADIKLPKHSQLKQFSVEIMLMGNDLLKCKLTALKNLKIDSLEALAVQKSRRCGCTQ